MALGTVEAATVVIEIKTVSTSSLVSEITTGCISSLEIPEGGISVTEGAIVSPCDFPLLVVGSTCFRCLVAGVDPTNNGTLLVEVEARGDFVFSGISGDSKE